MQLGNICASFAYQDYDKPYYHDGNTKLLAIDILAILTFIVAKVYYVWRNNQKEKTWKSMSEPERVEYTRYNKTKGSKRLDFRFAH